MVEHSFICSREFPADIAGESVVRRTLVRLQRDLYEKVFEKTLAPVELIEQRVTIGPEVGGYCFVVLATRYEISP